MLLSRTKALKADALEHVLRLLTPQNELVCRVCLATGLRVGDVLALRTQQLRHTRITIREHKTGKRKTVQLPVKLLGQLLAYAGTVYVFPLRGNPLRHRTRQAVYKDIKRAQRALRLSGTLGTHTMRKTYAVRKYSACGDMRKVKQLLNHSDECVTWLYALAEQVGLDDRRGTRAQRAAKPPLGGAEP